MSRTPFTQAEIAAHGKLRMITALNLPAFSASQGVQCVLGLVYLGACTGRAVSDWDMPGFLHHPILQAIELTKPVPERGQPEPWILSSDVQVAIASQLNVEV